VKVKDIGNIANKITSRKRYPYKHRKSLEHQADMTRIYNHHGIFLLKTINTENKERILMALREKNQITDKGRPSK
jgi:hypothetical protein